MVQKARVSTELFQIMLKSAIGRGNLSARPAVERTVPPGEER